MSPGSSVATRARLIEATEELLRTNGPFGVTMRGIAAVAGVTEGAIYRHFASKADLAGAVLSEQEGRVTAQGASILKLAGTATIEGNLSEPLDVFAQSLEVSNSIELMKRADLGLNDLAGSDLAARATVWDAAVGALTEYIRVEQELGRVRADIPAAVVAGAVLAMAFGARLLRASGGDGPSVAQILSV